MAKQDLKPLVPDELIESKIYLIRGQRVMLDLDLAELYGMDTRQLKRAVKRNMERFPADFMFSFTSGEYEFWGFRHFHGYIQDIVVTWIHGRQKTIYQTAKAGAALVYLQCGLQ